MKNIYVSFSNYEYLKRKGQAIVTFNTKEIINIDDSVNVYCKDHSVVVSHLIGIHARVKRISCISGFDTDGTPLNIADIRKV